MTDQQTRIENMLRWLMARHFGTVAASDPGAPSYDEQERMCREKVERIAETGSEWP